MASGFAGDWASPASCWVVVTDVPPSGSDKSACPASSGVLVGDTDVDGDVLTVRPDGQFIKIAQTRQLAAEIYFRPQEGRQRFFIIDEADRLREEAANSLLKTLEEPPPTSTIILLTAKPNALLQTIRSRAQRLSFAPLPTAEMEAFLSAHYHRPLPDTALLARLTEGRIGLATAIDLSVYRQERNVLVNLLDLLARGNNRYRLLKAAEYLGKKERDEFEQELDLLTRLLRDLFLLAAGSPREAIVNVDLAEKLEQIATSAGTQKLITWAERFAELRASLRFNVNRQLATEALLLSLSGN